MANVTHVDSAGLVGGYTAVTKTGGSMKLVGLTKRLHDLLAITKLLTVFDTFDSDRPKNPVEEHARRACAMLVDTWQQTLFAELLTRGVQRPAGQTA